MEGKSVGKQGELRKKLQAEEGYSEEEALTVFRQRAKRAWYRVSRENGSQRKNHQGSKICNTCQLTEKRDGGGRAKVTRLWLSGQENGAWGLCTLFPSLTICFQVLLVYETSFSCDLISNLRETVFVLFFKSQETAEQLSHSSSHKVTLAGGQEAVGVTHAGGQGAAGVTRTRGQRTAD